MTLPRELRAGLIAILALGLLYWGINFLKGKNIFSQQTLVYAIYDRVDGLTPARPVMINGFQVGQVNRVYFHPDRDGRLIVEMVLTTDFGIPANTIARINSQNLLGDKNVEFDLGDSPIFIEHNDTLSSDIARSLTEEVNRQVLPLKQKAENLIGSIDTAMTLLTGFLNEQTRNNFMATFESVRRSFETLEHTTAELDLLITDNRKEITSIVDNVKEISDALGENATELRCIIDNTEEITDTLAQARIGQTFRKLNSALARTDTILDKVNRGEGSLGLLLNDRKLYDQLEAASHELNMLLLDVQYNPNRYLHFSVFGSSKEYDSEALEEIAKQKETRRREAALQSDSIKNENGHSEKEGPPDK